MMDEERNPPFFPLRTQTRSACQPPALLSGLPPPPPRSRTIGWTDGRTDGRTDSAGPARPGAGAQAGRAGGDLGVSAGCPLPTARPGTPLAAPGEAVWGFFSFSCPSPSARSPRGLLLLDGHRWVLGSAGPHQALAASPAGLGDATITSHSTPGPAPPTHPGGRSREQRRGGGRLRRGPRPRRPRFAPGPRLGRGAGAAFSLSSQPEAEGLFKFYFLFD